MSGFIVILFSIIGSIEVSNITSVCGSFVEEGGRVVLNILLEWVPCGSWSCGLCIILDSMAVAKLGVVSGTLGNTGGGVATFVNIGAKIL